MPGRLASLALAVAASTGLLVGSAVPATAAASDTYEADVIRYTNAHRAAAKVGKLALGTCLDRYAERQAAAMAAQKRMFHQPLAPILKACSLRMVAENVAAGYTTGQTVTAAWMNSPGHRANMLNKNYRYIGVGAVQGSNGRWYTSQVLALAK